VFSCFFDFLNADCCFRIGKQGFRLLINGDFQHYTSSEAQSLDLVLLFFVRLNHWLCQTLAGRLCSKRNF